MSGGGGGDGGGEQQRGALRLAAGYTVLKFILGYSRRPGAGSGGGYSRDGIKTGWGYAAESRALHQATSTTVRRRSVLPIDLSSVPPQQMRRSGRVAAVAQRRRCRCSLQHPSVAHRMHFQAQSAPCVMAMR